MIPVSEILLSQRSQTLFIISSLSFTIDGIFVFSEKKEDAV